MANTIQKRIKFSKGQIVPELVERTDMSFYDSSAQKMTNVVSTVYGGVRDRRGTDFVTNIYSILDKTKPTATSSVGGNTEDLFNNKGFTSSNVGLTRDVLTLNYGKIITGENLLIKDVRLTEGWIFQEGQENGIFTVPEEREYRVFMTAGGGGGSNSWGGRGGYIDCYLRLKAGDYAYTIGDGGAGAGAYVRNNDGVNGNDSTFKGEGVSITCKGGVRRRGRRNGGSGGEEGIVNKSFSVKNDVKKTSSGKQAQISIFGNGWGDGGNSQPNDEGAGFAGNRGGYKLGVGNIKLLVETSTDNAVWDTLGIYTITTNGNDILLDGRDSEKGFQYVRMSILGDELLNFTGTLSINSVRVYSEGNGKVRLEKFVYNDIDRLLFVFTNERALIYSNDKIVQVLDMPGLLDSYFDEMKLAYKDDTIVITHKDLRTKIIKRVEGFWQYSDLAWQNVPYGLFGAESRQKMSVAIKPSVAEGAVTITADSGIFDESWVGQYIDGNGGKVRIATYESATKVSGNTVIPFYTDEKFSTWEKISGYEPVWSEARGYPRTCLFAQQRLWFGGSRDKGSNLWSSRIGDYFNFKNSGNFDNDAIDVELLTNNVILNLEYNRGLHILTSGEEMTASEGSLTPDKISIITNTRIGSYAKTSPLVMSGNIIFLEKNGKSILNYVYNDSQAAFTTDNLTLLSNLVNKPLRMDAEINSSRDKGDFVYIVLEDGTMIVGCVVLEQNIFSLSTFEIKGKVLDVCCLLDTTYILVERNGIVSIEKISEQQTDATRTYYVSGHEISGLNSYNDMDVCVFNDKFMERHRVQSGIIELDRDCEENVYVGVPFDYLIESNPIAINHKSQSIKKRIAKASVLTKDTRYITFNGQTKKGDKHFDFYSCSRYGRDVRFKLTGNFDKMEILSIVLNINYEG